MSRTFSQINISGSPPALFDNFVAVSVGGADQLFDHNQLMGPLRTFLQGLTLSNDGVTPNTIIDIAAGCACSDDSSNFMALSSAITKSINSTWAVGSGNGGLDTGAVAASTWYHVYLIMRTDTGVVDALISTSASSPTMPTNYTEKRRIGSILTDASKHIIPFTQFGDEFLWKTIVQDVADNESAPPQQTLTLTVPTGVRVFAYVNYLFFLRSGGGQNSIIYPLDIGDQTSANWIGTAADDCGILVRPSTVTLPSAFWRIRTNTSAQIAYTQSGAGVGLELETLGWIDLRGKV